MHAALLKGVGRVQAACDRVEIISEGCDPSETGGVVEAGQVGDLGGHWLCGLGIDGVEEARRVQRAEKDVPVGEDVEVLDECAGEGEDLLGRRGCTHDGQLGGGRAVMQRVYHCRKS